MRKLVLLAAGAMVAAIVGLPSADAGVRSYWDQSAGKWVKFDDRGQVNRNVNRSRHSGGGSSIRRQTIKYDGPFRPNTIVINTKERRLYHIMNGGKAMKYGVGVGREGFQWSGTDRISRKAEWPGWTPPPEMIARERKKGRRLPAYMPGGPRNPLGARALYIGSSLYRIHGSNEPWTIGRAVSSGCIRLTNDDIVHLYSRVSVGTRVVVLQGNESNARLQALARPPARKAAPKAATEVAKADDKPDQAGNVAAMGDKETVAVDAYDMIETSSTSAIPKEAASASADMPDRPSEASAAPAGGTTIRF